MASPPLPTAACLWTGSVCSGVWGRPGRRHFNRPGTLCAPQMMGVWWGNYSSHRCGQYASEVQHDGSSFILHKLGFTLCMLIYTSVKVFVKAFFQFYLSSFLLNSLTRFCLTSCIPASRNNPDRQFQCFLGWIPASIIPEPEKNIKFWHHVSIHCVSSTAWYKGQASNYPKEQRMIKMDSPSLHTRIKILGLGLGGLKLMLHSLSWSPFALLWKKNKLK